MDAFYSRMCSLTPKIPWFFLFLLNYVVFDIVREIIFSKNQTTNT
jgi:hypothetical protein